MNEKKEESTMRRKKRVRVSTDVPRPACSVCGEAADCELSLEARELVLEDGDWHGDYHRRVVDVSTLLCAGCLRARVKVGIAIEVTVDKVGS